MHDKMQRNDVEDTFESRRMGGEGVLLGAVGLATTYYEHQQTRSLMSSVTQSNPKHAPGWIAAARVEEIAGRDVAAREMIVQGVKNCPHEEDVWLEAARLELKTSRDAAKSVIAQGTFHTMFGTTRSNGFWIFDRD